MSDWFVWNFGTILLWSGIGAMVWLACQTNEMKAKVKSPVLMGLVASLIGALELGLTSIVSAGIYMLFLHVFKYWYIQFKGKQFEGITIQDDDVEKETIVEPEVVVKPKKVDIKHQVK